MRYLPAVLVILCAPYALSHLAAMRGGSTQTPAKPQSSQRLKIAREIGSSDHPRVSLLEAHSNSRFFQMTR
jgi:hypothetical protein